MLGALCAGASGFLFNEAKASATPALPASDGGPAMAAGWSCEARPFDHSLEGLTNEQLIDRLQAYRMSCLNLPPRPPTSASIPFPDDIIPLAAPDGQISILAPELRELARRGLSALPALLEHVTDSRPIGMTLAIASPRGSKMTPSVTLTDDYDSRALPAQGTLGVNTRARTSFSGGDGYAIKVGDLCYVAIGQIVNRRLFVFSEVDCGFDEHGKYKVGGVMNARPFGFAFIDSPVETPALAAAVRSDWSGLDRAAHAASLRADFAVDRDGPGALARLLYYYPAEGRRAG